MYLAKYTGGKAHARKQIFDILRSELLNSYDDWLEPFVGAGSIFFKAIENKIAKNYYANDINSDLINIYNNFNNESIAKFFSISKEYLQLNSKDDIYMFFKSALKKYNDAEIKDSHIFLFLINFCYGGIVRYNKNKLLNHTANYSVFELDKSLFLKNREKMYSKMLELLQKTNVKFFNCDYRDFLSATVDSSKKQIIFLDPPYESDTVAYNADKIGTYDARAYLTDFKAYKTENNILLITIRANEEDVYDVFSGYHAKYYALNITKRINYRFNKKEKINDCLIIVQ